MENNVQIGDIVICINNKRINLNSNGRIPPLRLNAEYIVQNIRVCECGEISYDVGLMCENNIKFKCGAQSSPHTKIWWCGSQRFVKKQNKISLEKQLNNAIEKEDYLEAEKIKKLLNEK